MLEKGTTVRTTRQLRNTLGVFVPIGTEGTMQSTFTTPNDALAHYVRYGDRAYFIAREQELEVISGND